jgi:hypothetical protein
MAVAETVIPSLSSSPLMRRFAHFRLTSSRCHRSRVAGWNMSLPAGRLVPSAAKMARSVGKRSGLAA